MASLAALCTTVVGKILLALIVWFVGKFVVKKLVELTGKVKSLEKLEPNTRTFILSAVKWLLYIILPLRITATTPSTRNISPTVAVASSPLK